MRRAPDPRRAARTAYRTLLAAAEARLPVDVAAIARKLRRARLMTYTEAARIAGGSVYTLIAGSPSRLAFTLMESAPGGARYIILYNDDPCFGAEGTRRFSIAHELGHILLGHFEGAPGAGPAPAEPPRAGEVARSDGGVTPQSASLTAPLPGEPGAGQPLPPLAGEVARSDGGVTPQSASLTAPLPGEPKAVRAATSVLPAPPPLIRDRALEAEADIFAQQLLCPRALLAALPPADEALLAVAFGLSDAAARVILSALRAPLPIDADMLGAIPAHFGVRPGDSWERLLTPAQRTACALRRRRAQKPSP